MSRLPVCSGAEAVKAFEKAGWTKDRQSGSHISLKKAGERTVLTVPNHKELAPGMLRRLIRDSGLTVGEFADLLFRHFFAR
jgi:predicted RNA binding protein YcfA (HicA-like mRNA interferase family)